MRDIKSDLLETGIVYDCEYLDKYCELIINNAHTEKNKGKTQRHHIIPNYYAKINEISLIKNPNNIVNLLYKDHILAHYYLALCSSSAEYRIKNFCSMLKMTGARFMDIEDVSPMEFMQSLDHYQEIYECYSQYRRKSLMGIKQTEEHIRKRVEKNRGQKRTEETRKKMGEWQKGKPKSKEARENMKKAQRKYADTESEEHKSARIEKARITRENWTEEKRDEIRNRTRQFMLGRTVSEHERMKKSEALTGKPKSDTHKLNVARARSAFRYYIGSMCFESLKEVVNYLIETTGINMSIYKWKRVANGEKIVEGIKITRELKEGKGNL